MGLPLASGGGLRASYCEAGRVFAQAGTTCSTRLLPEHALSSRAARMTPARTRTQRDVSMAPSQSRRTGRLRPLAAALLSADEARKPDRRPGFRQRSKSRVPSQFRHPRLDNGGVWERTIPTPCLLSPALAGLFLFLCPDAFSRAPPESEPRLGDRRGSGLTTFTGGLQRVCSSLAPKAYVRLYAAVHTRALSLAGDCSARAAVRAAPLRGHVFGRRHEGERRVANRVISVAPVLRRRVGVHQIPRPANASRECANDSFSCPRLG
jgi:hypothetical protein